MKILLDMNLSPRWVQALAAAGITSVHWSSVGSAQASDPEIIAYARSESWVILTQDLDFGTILAVTHGDKPSVIQIRADDVSPEAAANVVVAAVSQMTTELEEGALLTVDPQRVRLRYLPLR